MMLHGNNWVASTDGPAFLLDIQPKADPSSFLEQISKPVYLPQTPFQLELERTKTTTIEFSKYPDNTLRLYKPDSLIGDTPAGYNEQNVSVKVMVTRQTEQYMVSIKITRRELDLPGAEEKLAIAAYNWRSR